MLQLPIIQPNTLTPEEIRWLQGDIRFLAKKRKAVILAHNYQRPEVQEVADYVGDSLGLSRYAAKTDSDVIVFCGVHFMAETAVILSPQKTVLLPDLRAGCSLADQINADDVRKWKAEYPDHVTVGYVNTTAEVKAELDYCCTSGNAVEIIDAVPEDKGILFLPDFFLGQHLKLLRPDREIKVWMGECHVHKEIRASTVNERIKEYPDAEVLVHPECGCAGQLLYETELGDVDRDVHVLSTEAMVERTKGNSESFIIATEVGILDRLKREIPGKNFIAADPEAKCAYMKTITLQSVWDSLEGMAYRITVPEDIASKARGALNRMVNILPKP